MEIAIIITSISLILFVGISALLGLKIVKQSEVIIVERFGKYHKTLTAGINIIWPVMDKVRKMEWKLIDPDGNPDDNIDLGSTLKEVIDLRETVFDFPRQNVITMDNVKVQINVLIYFQITDPVKAMYEIKNLSEGIEKITQTTLRNVIGGMDLDGVLTSRDNINSTMRWVLDDITNKWGTKINRVELQDIKPSEDVTDVMKKQMIAERQKRATILEAEGKKQAKILVAEGEKQAIDIIAKALGDDGGTSVNYLIATQYLKTLESMTSKEGDKTILLPYEATGVLGALGGIKEMIDKNKIK